MACSSYSISALPSIKIPEFEGKECDPDLHLGLSIPPYLIM